MNASKIINDYRLSYLDDLFEIKMIQVVFWNLLNLHGRYVFQYYKSYLSIFSL